MKNIECGTCLYFLEQGIEMFEDGVKKIYGKCDKAKEAQNSVAFVVNISFTKACDIGIHDCPVYRKISIPKFNAFVMEYNRKCTSEQIKSYKKLVKRFGKEASEFSTCDVAIMCKFDSLWIGIEPDGYTHS